MHDFSSTQTCPTCKMLRYTQTFFDKHDVRYPECATCRKTNGKTQQLLARVAANKKKQKLSLNQVAAIIGINATKLTYLLKSKEVPPLEGSTRYWVIPDGWVENVRTYLRNKAQSL